MNRLTNLLFTGILCLLTFSEVAGQHADNEKLDVLIQNACVFDGTGRDSVFVDVGVRGDRIVFVGEPGHAYRAGRVIDGEGLYLAPGFIDPHSHYNRWLSHDDPQERALMRCLSQGVTTVFMNNDGTGPFSFPIGKALADWEKLGVGVNVGLFVPHNTVRTKVIGFRNIGVSSSQLEQMKGMVEEGMREGGFGLSTGLFYSPAIFANTEEVIELAKIAAAYGGIYDTHQRDDGEYNIGLINSVKEVLEIGEKANIPVHIAHIEAMGPSMWGKSREIIRMVEEAQSKGLKVSADQYPYLASRTHLRSSLLPIWVLEGGYEPMRARLQDPLLKDSILRDVKTIVESRTGTAEKLYLSTVTHTYLDGKTLAEVAKEWSVPVEEAIVRIALSEPLRLSILVHSFGISEEDMLNFMVQPWVMTGSDGDQRHPRGFGAFARILREYSLDRGLFSMAHAIHRSSGLTASTLNIKDRGLIQEGYFADLVLFDPNEIRDNATFEQPEQLASGVHYVFVNGKLTIDNGKYTGALAGKALRLN